MIRLLGKPRQGFSLVELVVVLAIAGITLGLVIPAVYSAQDAAGVRQTMNSLKQVTLAAHSANDAYKYMPPAYGRYGACKFPASVHVYLLPYIEKGDWYKEYLDAEGKGAVTKFVLPFYISPIDPSAGNEERKGIQNYAANLRVFSEKGYKTPVGKNMDALAEVEPGKPSLQRLSSQDGASNTIAFATKYGSCGEDGGSRYASPPNTRSAAFFGQNAAKKKADPADPTATFQLHPSSKQCLTSPLMAQSFLDKGLQISVFDGSVRNVSPKISPTTWNYAVQPNDGMSLGTDW
jgi:prepilin-type N-terminal cleavage/methylation domain-containing protein